MKHLFLIACLLACTHSYGQSDSTKIPLPFKDGQIVYEETISLDSAYTAQILYKTAKTWFVNNFQNVKSVIQSEDQVNGRFLARGIYAVKGVTMFNNPITPNISFYIQIDVKKGKYRYRFYNFNSIGDLFDDKTEVPVERAYSLYLENKNPKGFISREAYNKRADMAFINFNNSVGNLGASLKDAMARGKSDEF